MHLARLQRLQTTLTAERLDAAAVLAGPNLFYLTGLPFHLSERPTVGFFPADGEPVFVVPTLEASKLEGGAPYPLQLFAYTDADGPAAAFAQAAAALKPGAITLGVEARRMRLMEADLIAAVLPQARRAPAETVFARLRMAKDADEIARMRQATRIAEQALRQTLPLIRLGMTERELGAELVIQSLRAGAAAELPFAPIVASGPNGALPHAFVTDRKLQAGDLLTLDWGVAWESYQADLTRTFALGPVAPELERIYNLVRDANAAARAHARPGVTCASVDAAARQVIAAGGYGAFFTHRVGHGLGLEGHEDPSLHGKNETLLEPGFTFTIEPGIYVPNLGGARIEDDMLVTAAGVESLSSYPRELQVLNA